MMARPRLFEHLSVHGIANAQRATFATDHAGQLEPRSDLIQLVVDHDAAAADVSVRAKHRLAIERLLRQHVANELQVAVGLSFRSEEQLADSSVDGRAG